MKITDFLPKRFVVVTELKGVTKPEVIQELTTTLLQCIPHLEPERLSKAIEERERLKSTAIGAGVAIPHGKLKGLCQMALCFGRSAHGVDFDSHDGELVHYFFLLVAPDVYGTLYLRMLAAIARLLKETTARKHLPLIETESDVLAFLATEEIGAPTLLRAQAY